MAFDFQFFAKSLKGFAAELSQVRNNIENLEREREDILYAPACRSDVTAGMTATKMHVDPNAPTSREVVTAELMYYWMISMNIPMECEHWHLNRLFTLIRVFNLKNSPKKQMSSKDRQQLNMQRRQQYQTRG